MNEIINYVMETPGNTNPNILRGILQNSSGSNLPPVTAADDGKLLGVDGGEWKAVDAPAGMEEITYSALRALQNDSKLVPGKAYRIIDYVTVINGTYDLSAIGASGYVHYATSAGHPFDIIVVADDESHLNENARAALHSGDTYFANSKLGGVGNQVRPRQRPNPFRLGRFHQRQGRYLVDARRVQQRGRI